MKQKKNNLIIWWKRYFRAWLRKTSKKLNWNEQDIKNALKIQAQAQLDKIDSTKPNKEKLTKEQLNDIQLEYYEWLEKVYQEGTLDV